MTHGRRKCLLRRLLGNPQPEQASLPSSPDPTADGRYDIALEEGRRSLNDQLAQIGKIRSVAGSLLGFGGVAFSVLAVTPNPHSEGQRWLLVTAVILFAALATVTVWNMWPVALIPGAKSSDIVGWIDQDGKSDDAARNLALHYDTAYQKNQDKLTRHNTATMWALGLFSATIVVLVIRLIGT